jgi:hypothetical protein
MNVKTMLVASILLGIMSTARADGFMSGNDIFQNCGSSDPLRHQYCGWYVLGAVDGFQTDQDNLKKTLGFCLPRVTQGQIIDMVVKFFTDNPNIRHYSAASGVLRAMQLAFPCG